MLLHMLVIFVLGSCYQQLVRENEEPLETIAADAIQAEQLEKPPPLPIITQVVDAFAVKPDTSLHAGGANAQVSQLATGVSATDITPPTIETAKTPSWVVVGDAGQAEFAGRLGETTVPLYTASTLQGAGAGEGNGNGEGKGGGFFGRRGLGRSFVYVVDCSGSMNYPHPSEWKTRFQRVKFEILKSVSNMPPENRFFIIFFNQHAHPMPAPAMISTDPDRAQPYLAWMSRVVAQDETDPRKALQLALGLKPDVIFLLTDGAFTKKVQSSLARIQQTDSAIHTFSFGQRAGEATLQDLSQRNGGEYHFIP